MVSCQHASTEIRGKRRYELLKASQTQLIQIQKNCLVITFGMQRLTVALGGGAWRFLKCIQPDQESEVAIEPSLLPAALADYCSDNEQEDTVSEDEVPDAAALGMLGTGPTCTTRPPSIQTKRSQRQMLAACRARTRCPMPQDCPGRTPTQHCQVSCRPARAGRTIACAQDGKSGMKLATRLGRLLVGARAVAIAQVQHCTKAPQSATARPRTRTSPSRTRRQREHGHPGGPGISM